MQSSFQIVDNLIRGKSAERVGVFDVPWNDTRRKWVTQGYPTDAAGDPLTPAEHFNFDMVESGGWFDIMPLKGVLEVVEESDEWVIRRNGAGASLKWWKNKSGTPEHVAFRMTSRDIWEKDYRPHLLTADPGRLRLEGNRKNLAKFRQQNRWTFFGHQFVWETMRGSMGDICLYESMLLDPGWVDDFCRVYTDFYKAHFSLLFEQVGKPDGVWLYEDLGYKEHLFCSPQLYRDRIFPYFREMVDFFHAQDLPVVLHTCGLVGPALDLIVEAGFDALNPMEVKAGNDPLQIAAKYKDKLAFIGGLDARVLESHDKAIIRREVAKLIDGMKSVGARYVFASDHSLSTNVNYDDFQYAMEVYREHMWY